MPKKNLKTANLTKILGVHWDKNRNNLSIVVPEFDEKLITKRNVLSYIASIYEPLGLISAVILSEKLFAVSYVTRKFLGTQKSPKY